MLWFPTRAAVVVAVCAALVAGPVAASAEVLRPLALPTRRDPAQLERQVREVGRALAARLGVALAAPAPSPELDERIRRGRQLAASGALDRAARELDDALAAGADAPHRIGDAPSFVDAHVDRLAIALARGEDRAARELVDRLLQYDPGFTLRLAEKSPRVDAAIADARARLGEAAPLHVETLGSACAGDGTLLVARGRADGSTELLRFDRCRLVARASATGAPTEELAAALDPLGRRPQPQPPFYRRRWFWMSAAAVAVAGGAAAIYLGTRGEPELHVDPHL